MTTTTRKFNVGDPVLVDMPSYCLQCGRDDIGAYGTVAEHGLYGQYVVTLDSARDATGYDPDGNPVHVCGLRMICNEGELKLVDGR